MYLSKFTINQKTRSIRNSLLNGFLIYYRIVSSFISQMHIVFIFDPIQSVSAEHF